MNSFFKEHFFQVFAALLSIVAATWAVYIQFVEVRNAQLIDRVIAEKQLHESQRDLQEIQRKLMDVVDDKLTLSKEELTKLSITNELNDFNSRLDDLTKKTLALRQAINPLKPDEVLTIARLTDEVKALQGEFETLEKATSEKHKEFSASILRELKSSNDATNLILVVLIPLLLNFLYTVWKDFKSERKDETPNK